MVAYRQMIEEMGYTNDKVIFADESKEIIFSQNGFRVAKSLHHPMFMLIKFQGKQLIIM